MFIYFDDINVFYSRRSFIAEMSLIFKFLFLVLACQALPLNSSPDELQEEEVSVTDRFSKDEMSIKLDQNDENDNDSSLAKIDDDKQLESAGRLEPKSGSPGPVHDGDYKVPMINHLTADQINEMQAEQNANFDFSQNFYVNLNGACNLESITQLVAFLILTLL